MADSSRGTPRWRRTPQDRTAAILDAALSEFALKGLNAAKMDDIALAGGLSKGSIYRYFPDKNALYSAAVQVTLQQVLGGGGGGTPLDRQLFLRKAWSITADARFRSAYRLSLIHDPALSAIRASAMALVENNLVKPFALLLGQTERESALPQDAPLIRARMAISMMIGAALSNSNTAEAMDAGVAFLLRACELEAESPQADGF